MDGSRAETLAEALERAARSRDPDTGLRLLDRDERPTWHGWDVVYERAVGVARGLLEWGLRPGERAALVFPTSAAFFDAFFGVLMAGGCPVPLYPPVRLGRLDEYARRTAGMLRASSARLALADPRVRRLLGESLALAADDRTGATPTCLTLPELPDGGPASLPRVGPDALALVQFSSGTTGEPHPVALTHRALEAQSAIIEKIILSTDAEVAHHAGVSWLPLYHDMGLVGCVLPALFRRSVLTLLGPEHFVARPAAWLRAISTWGGTVSPAPNFAYGLCVERIRDEELEGVDLSRWRLALNGAEPVAPSVLRAFQQRFARWGLRPEALTPVYGLAEAALAVTFSDPARPFASFRFDRGALSRGDAVPSTDGVELVSVGTPVPGFSLEVTDEQGRELPAGRVGRVRVRGPSLMAGYLDLPEQTREVLRDGWLETGDLGFLHQGQLVLTGRSKDALVIRGRKHPPHVVEHAVDAVPGVRTGCAAAVSHLPEGGAREILVLMVEHSRDCGPRERDALPDACRRAVLQATGLSCDRVVVLSPGTLPRTSSGKLRRREALRLYLAGTLAPPEPVTTWRVLFRVVRSAAAIARARLAAWRRGAAR